MWRALFLAIGIYMILLGVECLGVERVNLKVRDDPPPRASLWEKTPEVGPRKTITPPTWAPWSLMSAGAVVCLYSFTIPRRVKGD